MKKLIYLWLLASVLLAAACTDDDDVFSEESWGTFAGGD